MKKRFLLACLLMSSMLAYADAPLPQKTLVVAAFPSVDLIIKDALPIWRKRHPEVNIKLISREFNDHHSALTLALATGSKLPDVTAIEYGLMGRIANSGGLENLAKQPYDATRYQDKFARFAYDQAISKKGELNALPTDIGPGVMFYRQDILDKAGLKEADLTRSWDSYLQAARVIRSKTHAYIIAHARDAKDIVIRSNIASGNGIYFHADGTPAVNTPRFEKAFRLAKQIRAEKLDGNLLSWSNEWSEGLRRGTIATQMMGAWFGGHLETWLAPKTHGLWRTSLLPENTKASWGGTFYAISKTSEEKALAWEFIQLMTTDKHVQLLAFKQHNSFPALLEAQEQDFFADPVPFFGNQQARLIWKLAATGTPSVKVSKFDPFAEEVVNSELDKVLNNNKDIKTALHDAHRLLTKRIVR